MEAPHEEAEATTPLTQVWTASGADLGGEPAWASAISGEFGLGLMAFNSGYPRDLAIIIQSSSRLQKIS